MFIIGAAVLSSLIFTLIEASLINFKFTRLSFQFDKTFLKTVLVSTFFFVINDVFIVIFFKIDSVMLSLMKGDVETGIYGAAYNLLYAVTFIPMVLSTVLYPVLTRFYATNKKLFKNNLTIIVKYFLLAAIPVVLFFVVFAEPLIILIYESKYMEAVPVLRIIGIGLLFVFLNFVLSMILNTVEKQKFVAISSFSAMALNLILNFILIPKFSIMGATVATVITEFTFCTFLMFFVHRSFKIINKKTIWKLVLVTSSTAIGVAAVLLTNINEYISYVLFLVVFVGCLFLFRIFSKKDKEYLFDALHIK
jgi:O-antigen/teichoic acid export membrane protein